NEMPYTAQTLAALAQQKKPSARILFIDCHSTDGSRETAARAGVELLDLPPESYIPGRVLNMGMERTRSEVVAFVNADAIPRTDDALNRLVRPLLSDPDAAAAYGRQVARPDADALTRSDYDRAFGSTALVTRFGPFFSMAASA